MFKRAWRLFSPPVSLAVCVPAGEAIDWLVRADQGVPPAARQGTIAAAAASQWQTLDIQTIPDPQNDRTLATNSQTCRTSTAESSGLRSPLH